MADNKSNVELGDVEICDTHLCRNKRTGRHAHHHNSSQSTSSSSQQQTVVDRLKLLYPNVNEDETPLPRSWSTQDKCHAIGLSLNNLRVHYKGAGKNHQDAASVRTDHPIPASCGLYYFEVKIISKGKNGYMGIGLTSQNFKMNRLPGWDKQSYGYHGDDGNSFCSSGNGQSYGPTFTTGDVIGCGVNMINSTCFYTKNGLDLGIAFRDLPDKLYPTVGLQTPGEEVDANFGQEPFVFDQIEDMIKQLRAEAIVNITNFPLPHNQGESVALIHKMVSSYLVHNGYSNTAECFAKVTGQDINEELSSIKTRQKILKLVMSGRMGQAIEQTLSTYPGLLESNQNLLFMLKCRQFVEMVNGSDIEGSNSKSSPNQTSVIQSTKSYQNGSSTNNVIGVEGDGVHDNQDMRNTTNFSPTNSDSNKSHDLEMNSNNDYMNDVEMENGHITNGNGFKEGDAENNYSLNTDEDMDVDVAASRKAGAGFERILEFGRELFQMGQQLEKENRMNDSDRKMLEDAFSLIAYSNPWSSPLGYQLCPSKREPVCSALNSAILEIQPSQIAFKGHQDNLTMPANDEGITAAILNPPTLSKRNRSQSESSNHKRNKRKKTGDSSDPSASDEKKSNEWIELAVIDSSVADGNITSRKYREIECELAGNFLKLMEDFPGQPPQCRDGGWYQGRIKLMHFANQRSAELFKVAIAKVGEIWPGAKLEVVPFDTVPKIPSARTWLRGLEDLPNQNWIIESKNYPWRPPLEICIAHAYELLRLMATHSLGHSAFVSIEDIYPKH